MLKVTVVRKNWSRGIRDESKPKHDQPVNALLKPNTGMMCCMGFAAKEAGLTDRDIEYIGAIRHLQYRGVSCPQSLLEFLKQDNGDNRSSVASAIYGANDDLYCTDEDREDRLKRLGKRVGIDFTFVD